MCMNKLETWRHSARLYTKIQVEIGRFVLFTFVFFFFGGEGSVRTETGSAFLFGSKRKFQTQNDPDFFFFFFFLRHITLVCGKENIRVRLFERSAIAAYIIILKVTQGKSTHKNGGKSYASL